MVRTTKAELIKQIEKLQEEKAILLEHPNSFAAWEIAQVYALERGLEVQIWNGNSEASKELNGILNQITAQ